MITRLLGRDAEVDFSEDTLDAVHKLEARFPCPGWAVVFEESEGAGPDAELVDEDVEIMQGEPEDLPQDTLILCRRHSGILVEMAWMGLDEIGEMETDGVDWVSELTDELSRTEAQIAREESAGQA